MSLRLASVSTWRPKHLPRTARPSLSPAFFRRHPHRLAMGKNKTKKAAVPNESHLSLPAHPNSDAATTPIVDTHTHLLSTFSAYKRTYPTGRYDTLWDFVRGVYRERHVKAIVDVWCEAPVQRTWKELADAALSAEDRTTRWGGIAYWFVMGAYCRTRLVCPPRSPAV